jgi:PLD-like domain
MTSEGIFENIAERIEEEINKSQKDIYLAVAWFTNKNLFNSLVKKSQEGVKVILVISDNEINRNSSINYNDIQKGESKLFWLGGDKSFMHNKFCIIDDYVIITGSYNWSYKAETNFENVVITSGDGELATQLKNEINRIIGELLTDEKKLLLSKILKRLEIIKNYIILEELEDLDGEIRKIIPFDFDDKISEIIQEVKQQNFGSAIKKIETFINLSQSMVTYIDYELEGIKIELKILENELAALEGEKMSIEKLLADFNHQYTRELGDVVLEILYIKSLLVEDDEVEYEKAKQEEEEYRQQVDEEEKKVKFELNEEEKGELKKMYRKGVFKCFPDLFQNESQEVIDMFTEIFKSLNEANEKQDLNEVRRIIDMLDNNSFMNFKKKESNDKIKLASKKEFLRNKISKLKVDLNYLKESEKYIEIIQIEDFNQYFKNLRQQLKDHLSSLRNTLNLKNKK